MRPIKRTFYAAHYAATRPGIKCSQPSPPRAGRMGVIREFVEAVLYLEVATFVTGETLHVDGGLRTDQES